MTDDPNFFAAAAALGKVEVLDVEAMRFVYRVERSGETFYEKIAERLASPEASQLLLKNAREERGHAERMRRAIALKLGRVWEPEASDLAPYAVPLPDAIPAALLQGIVQGELDGDTGYQRWADREADPEVQKLLRQNGREETQHAERVRQAIALLSR